MPNPIKPFLITILFLFFGNTFCHEMNPARLLLEEQEDGTYSGNWMFPSNAVGLPAEVSFTGCNEGKRNLPRIEGKYLVSQLSINCEDSIKGKEINLKGLSRITDALISINFKDGTKFEGLATVSNSKITVPQEVSIYPTVYFWLVSTWSRWLGCAWMPPHVQGRGTDEFIRCQAIESGSRRYRHVFGQGAGVESERKPLPCRTVCHRGATEKCRS